jgi:hypothetical protein
VLISSPLLPAANGNGVFNASVKELWGKDVLQATVESPAAATLVTFLLNLRMWWEIRNKRVKGKEVRSRPIRGHEGPEGE